MHTETNLDDFDIWNEKKKELNTLEKDVYFKEGEIWWCFWGMNVGEEVYGKGKDFQRPAVILKKLSKTSAIALPVTAVPRKGSWYHFINPQGNPRWVMMHQIKFVSINRLSRRQFSLSLEEFSKLKESEAELLGLFHESSPEFLPDRWVTPNVIKVYQDDLEESIKEYFDES